MNILIIGGAGFLGNHLVRRCLKEKGDQVTVVDSLDPRLRSTTDDLEEIRRQIKFIKGDMRDAILMGELVQEQDVIFNCAGQTSHLLSLSDPFLDIDINCSGNLTVLEAVRKHNKEAKVIFTSSSTVTGKTQHDAVDESHGEVPLDIYSANKGVAEKYHRIYNRVHGLKTLSLRFANLYGPYGKGYPEFGFVNYFISLAQNDQEIKIFGDGRQTRNVMYAGDAADLLYECVSHDNIFGDVFFAVHRGQHYSVMDIAQEIVSVFRKGRIHQVPWPEVRKRIEIDNAVISGDKLYQAVHFEPKYIFRQGLERTRQIIESRKDMKTTGKGASV